MDFTKSLRCLCLIFAHDSAQWSKAKNMNSVTLARRPHSRTPRNRAAFEDGLPLRIGALRQERDALDEEVRQLRAAVQLYTEVLRRLQIDSRVA